MPDRRRACNLPTGLARMECAARTRPSLRSGAPPLLFHPLFDACFARFYAPGFSTVHTDAHTGPPMLNVAAARAFFTWISAGAWPSSCSALQPIIATPVAPIGWPLAISPPDVLMPHTPAGAALPSRFPSGR